MNILLTVSGSSTDEPRPTTDSVTAAGPYSGLSDAEMTDKFQFVRRQRELEEDPWRVRFRERQLDDLRAEWARRKAVRP